MSGNIGYDEAKRLLVAEIQELFAEYENRYYELKKEPDYVLGILRQGSKFASQEAAETLENIRSLIGL